MNGGYRGGTSRLHTLDALVKLLCFFLLLAAVIGTRSLTGYILLLAEIGILIALSGIGMRAAWSGLRQMGLFFVLIFLMNAFFFSAAEPIVQWWIFCLTRAGIVQGMRVVLRVTLAMLLSNIFLAVTPPLAITGALESLLFPLGFVGVPVRDVAMILSAAIRFIPLFLEETEMIRRAQTARGARFESRRLTERAQAVLPLVIPIFLSAFRRADELSMAMEARGYRRTKGRAGFVKRHLCRADAAALILCTLAVTAAICL